MHCMRWRNKTIAVLFLGMLLTLSGCRKLPQKQTIQFFSMDTLMQITAYTNNDSALKSARKKIESLDTLLDATDPQSAVSLLCDGDTLNSDLFVPMQTAQKIAAETNGALDLTLYPLSDAWGFYTKDYKIPSEETIQNLLSDKGKWTIQGKKLTCTKPLKLDFGCVAKGYAAMQAAALLKADGIESAVLSLGGNVQTIGNKPDGSPWIIAIADPLDPQGSVGNLLLTNTAAVTSGSYQRNFTQNGKTYHHILDPKTGYPVDNDLLSVTVICNDGTAADGLSTALFIIGSDAALKLYQKNVFSFEALFITKKKEIYITEGLTERFEQTNTAYSQVQILR